jgi:hypothetical protein
MAAEQIRPAVSYRQETLFLICPAGRMGKGKLSIAIGDVRYGEDPDHRIGGLLRLLSQPGPVGVGSASAPRNSSRTRLQELPA